MAVTKAEEILCVSGDMLPQERDFLAVGIGWLDACRAHKGRPNEKREGKEEE